MKIEIINNLEVMMKNDLGNNKLICIESEIIKQLLSDKLKPIGSISCNNVIIEYEILEINFKTRNFVIEITDYIL